MCTRPGCGTSSRKGPKVGDKIGRNVGRSIKNLLAETKK